MQIPKNEELNTNKNTENKENFIQESIIKDFANNEQEQEVNENNINSTPLPAVIIPRKQKKFTSFPIQSIYDPSLVGSEEETKKYLCQLCQQICDDPVADSCGCGKIFCNKCLKYYLKNNFNKCPISERSIEKQPQKIDALTECINSLTIKCKNFSNGCEWKGKLSNFKKHIENECKKEFINCPNIDCFRKIMREEMLKHLLECEFRLITCSTCGAKIKFSDKKNHENICPKVIIKCPQGCDKNFERGELEKHKDNCPFTLEKCPFWEIGCKDMKTKKDINKMLENEFNKHLLLFLNSTKSKEENIEFKTEKLGDLFLSGIKTNKNKSNIEVLINDDYNKNMDNGNQQLLCKKRKISSTYSNGENTYNKNNSNKTIEQDLEGINASNKYVSMSVANYNEEESKQNNDVSLNFYEAYNLKNFFKTDKNIIISKGLNGKTHKYVFINKKYAIPRNGPKKYTIKFNLLDNTPWLSMGICDKKIVDQNCGLFCPKKVDEDEKVNTGSYVICVNRFAYNCNNIRQSKIIDIPEPLENKSFGQNGNIIECIVDPSECEIKFKLNGYLIKTFSDVRTFKDDFFTPCLIFLKNNTSVKTTFDY